MNPIEMNPGDSIALLVHPKDKATLCCDLTTIDLTIKSDDQTWSLWPTFPHVLESNPHRDSHGNPDCLGFVFVDQGEEKRRFEPSIPSGSLLDHWNWTFDSSARKKLAGAIAKVGAARLIKSTLPPPIGSCIPIFTSLESLWRPRRIDGNRGRVNKRFII